MLPLGWGEGMDECTEEPRGPGCGLHPWFAAEVLWAGYEMPLPSAHASLYLTGHPVASRVGTTSLAPVLCLTGAG